MRGFELRSRTDVTILCDRPVREHVCSATPTVSCIRSVDGRQILSFLPVVVIMYLCFLVLPTMLFESNCHSLLLGERIGETERTQNQDWENRVHHISGSTNQDLHMYIPRSTMVIDYRPIM